MFVFHVGARVPTPCGQCRRKIVARQAFAERNLYAFDLLDGRARKWYSETELLALVIGEQLIFRDRFGELRTGVLMDCQGGAAIFRYIDHSGDHFFVAFGAGVVECFGAAENTQPSRGVRIEWLDTEHGKDIA